MKKAAIVTLCVYSLMTQAQSTNQNYIHSVQPLTEVHDQTGIDNLSNSYKRENITYVDGLGRPVQKVSYRNSPTYKDLVEITEYDVVGRASKQYLPYSDSQNDRSYKSSGVSSQLQFYQGQSFVAHSNYPFSETAYDGTSREIITDQSFPGADWQMGGGHTVTTTYRSNDTNEVFRWSYANGNCVKSGYYDADKLLVTETMDENGSKTITFNDQRGVVILIQKEVSQSPSVFASTYYINDFFGKPLYVIPPQALADMTTYDVNSEVPDRVYRYVYDNRQRLIEKKVPHKGSESIVYDQLDRPILTQDAVQAGNEQWSFTKYDAMGRVVLTGLYDPGTELSRASLQTSADAASVISESRTSANYSTQHGYTLNSFPNSNLTIYTVKYYDDYDFNYNGTDDYSYTTPSSDFSTNSPTSRTNGLETGSKTLVLDGGSTYLYSINWYDNKGRLIQTYSDNHSGGYDRIDNLYNFANELTITEHKHQYDSETPIIIRKRMNYDHAGRLSRTYQKIDNETEIILADYTYNEIGELIDKKLHGVPYQGTTVPPGWTQTYLQSIDYSYNIRGWLTHMNNSGLAAEEYNESSGSPGYIASYSISSISFGFEEIEDEIEGNYIQMTILDDSEMDVVGTVNTDNYTSDDGTILRIMNDPGEGSGATLYASLQELHEESFEMVYSPELELDENTSLESLGTLIFGDVEDILDGEAEYTYQDGVEVIQNAVFNYVGGKASLVLQVAPETFSSEELEVTYVEKNGYQLYMRVTDDASTETTEIHLMDKNSGNTTTYDGLIALTYSSGTQDTTPIGINFGDGTFYEGMGTLAALAEAKAVMSSTLSTAGLTHQQSLDELEKYAESYALTEYGNTFFNDDENDLWGMELKYNTPTHNGSTYDLNTLPLYNGNISEMQWQSKGDDVKRGYGYKYDPLNRLIKGVYKAENSAGAWTSEVAHYSLQKVSYDLNGNIQHLKRKGFISGSVGSGTFGLMDNLGYSYTGDQLTQVSDSSTVHYVNDFDDGNTSGNDYTYDVNGNLTQDLNKGIQTITYNHLNLPTLVQIDGTHKIQYIYDAVGVKLQKVVTNGSIVATTDYMAIGNYIDVNGLNSGVPEFIFTEEGRAVDDNGSWRYEYYYKDHLGNTRLGFSDYNGDEVVDSTEITQQQNYYPFGLTHQGTYYGVAIQTTHKYLFQKQELQDEFEIGWYSFKWRNAMPELGRFFNVDPLAEKFNYNGVYNFSENRVIDGLELEGLEFVPLFGIGDFLLLSRTNTVQLRPIAEAVAEEGSIGKTPGTSSPRPSSSSFSNQQFESFARGNRIEAEQLAKNGLEKNTKPIEVIDPKTGNTGRTIPDAFKNGGKSTSEVKNVKSQSLTRQLRLQEKFSNDNGLNPELIINEGVKLSKPLQNSTFDIKFYEQIVIPNNTVPTDAVQTQFFDMLGTPIAEPETIPCSEDPWCT